MKVMKFITDDRFDGVCRKLGDRRNDVRRPSKSSLIASLEYARSLSADTSRFKLKPY